MFRPTLFGDKNYCWSLGFPFGHFAGFSSEWRANHRYGLSWPLHAESFGKGPSIIPSESIEEEEEEERPIWVPKENAMKLEIELTPEQAGDILQDLHWAARTLDDGGEDISEATSRLWDLLEDLRGQ